MMAAAWYIRVKMTDGAQSFVLITQGLKRYIMNVLSIVIRMVYQPRRYLIELPPHSPSSKDGGSAPPCPKSQQFQGLEEIIGNDPYPEEDRFSIGLTARHPFRAKAALKPFDIVLQLPTLIMKLDYLLSRLLSIGSDNVIAIRVRIE